MSAKVIDWVFDHSQAGGGDKLVLLAIAHCANTAGENAYPSTAELVRKTGLTARGVRKCTARLVEMGELEISPNAGPGRCNRYKVLMSGTTSSPSNPEHSSVSTPEHSSPRNTVPGLGNTQTDTSESTQVNTGETLNTVHPEHSSPRNTVPPEPKEVVVTLSTNTHSSSRKSTRRRATTTKATRIPDDFAATPEMITWARKDTPLVGREDTESFIDYWRGAAGSKAIKVDWIATWRNWMRRAQKDAEQRQSRIGSSRQLPASIAPVATPPAERCTRHPHERANACGPCRSEQIAKKTA